MPAADFLVEDLGDLADRASADAISEQAGQRRPGLAGGNAGEEDLLDRLIDRARAALIPLDDLGLKFPRAGAWHVQRHRPEGTRQITAIKAIGLIPAPLLPLIGFDLQMLLSVVEH